jgi:hypothetical protein
MSALCQKQTSSVSFDHLVRDREHARRNSETESFCDLEIDDKFEPFSFHSYFGSQKTPTVRTRSGLEQPHSWRQSLKEKRRQPFNTASGGGPYQLPIWFKLANRQRRTVPFRIIPK